MNKKHNRLPVILLLLFFCAAAGYAQKITVMGTVTDAQTQETLIGLTVKEKGTSNGAITDFDGKYTIQVEKNATLEFSYIGYETQYVAVNGRQTINVAMASVANALDELVVIGYGVQ